MHIKCVGIFHKEAGDHRGSWEDTSPSVGTLQTTWLQTQCQGRGQLWDNRVLDTPQDNTQHSVKGQMQLKWEKDGEKNITAVQPYRYDEEASLRKFYLAIIMHEYPFNISEHE